MGETSFQPGEIIVALERHRVRYIIIGGLAATLHGSPVMTTDADICPSREGDNLERLARALVELRARIRTPGVPEGLVFACDATFLSWIDVALNLMTRFGDLDLSFVPSGTTGFEDLRSHAVTMSVMSCPVLPQRPQNAIAGGLSKAHCGQVTPRAPSTPLSPAPVRTACP